MIYEWKWKRQCNQDKYQQTGSCDPNHVMRGHQFQISDSFDQSFEFLECSTQARRITPGELAGVSAGWKKLSECNGFFQWERTVRLTQSLECKQAVFLL